MECEIVELCGQRYKSLPPKWVIYQNNVFDIEGYILSGNHPGGNAVLKDAINSDITEIFESIGHSSSAEQQLLSFKIQPISSDEELDTVKNQVDMALTASLESHEKPTADDFQSSEKITVKGVESPEKPTADDFQSPEKITVKGVESPEKSTADGVESPENQSGHTTVVKVQKTVLEDGKLIKKKTTTTTTTTTITTTTTTTTTVEEVDEVVSEKEERKGKLILSISDLLDLQKPLIPQIYHLTRDEYDYLTSNYICSPTIYRFFPYDGLEILSRTHWWVIPLVWCPVSVLLTCLAHQTYRSSITSTIQHLFLGFFLWTLCEYLIHRFIFHFPEAKLPDIKLIRLVHFTIHGVHHTFPMDPLRLVVPPVLFIFLASLVYTPCRLILPSHFVHKVLPG
jgi:hypothetical protein